jgi:hypothetical protein
MLNRSFSLLAATEFELSLPPIWILSIGFFLALAALAIVHGLVLIGSRLPVLEKWRRNGVSFWLGLGLAAVATALFTYPLFSYLEANSRAGAETENWMYIPSIFVGSALVAWVLLYCSNKRFLSELPESLSSGVGAGLLIFVGVCCVVGLAITPIVKDPLGLLTSLPKVFKQGDSVQTVTVPGIPDDQDVGPLQRIQLNYEPALLRKAKIESDRKLVLTVRSEDADTIETPTLIPANTPVVWENKPTTNAPLPMAAGLVLYAQNSEIDQATVTFTLTSAVNHPEMTFAITVATFVFAAGIVWFLMLGAGPRLSAIAFATAKSELSQPLPLILMAIGSLIILAFIYIPFFTMGEDNKLVKDCGLSVIMIFCLFQGVWSASSSVSEEIEGRTALTLLSKPIHRRSFLFGKLMGILWLILLMAGILGVVELGVVSYKTIYDASESSRDIERWQECFQEMASTFPGLVMVFFQAATLTTLSVGIATRMSQLANFAICFSIYLVGQMTPSIVSAGESSFPIVRFISQLIAVLAPNLELYSMNGAIDSNTPIPFVYLSGLFIYSLLFCGLSTLLGLLLFEDRDVA